MSGWSETPIFPGTPKTTVTNIPASAASSYTIFTADSNYGGIVTAIRLTTKTTTARVGVRLELKDGSTTSIIGRISTTGTTQYATTDLLTSTYAPVNDFDPRLVLKAGQTLQITTENTEAGTLDVTVVGATFAYPN